MVPCEILFRDIKSVDLDTFQNDLIKSKLLDTPFLSSSSYNRKKKPKNNISEFELDPFKSLSQNKTL